MNGSEIEELRAKGYAVVIFNPDELDGADPEKVQDYLVGSGWTIISELKSEAKNTS